MADAIWVGMVGVLIAAALGYVARQIVLWYFRVGEVVSLLAEIRDRLPPPADRPTPADPAGRPGNSGIRATVGRSGQIKPL